MVDCTPGATPGDRPAVDPLNAADRTPPASRVLPPPPPATPPVPPMPGTGLDPDRRRAEEQGGSGAGGKSALAGGAQRPGHGATPGRGPLPAPLFRALAEGRGIGELFRALAVELVGAGENGPGPGREVLGELLGHAADAGTDGPGLARRLAGAGLFHEAHLARDGEGDRAGDLKAFALALAALAAAAAEAPPANAPAASAPRDVARAAGDLVAGIERDQWRELAAGRAGAPRRVALPWLGARGIATLELAWPRGRAAGSGPFGLTLAGDTCAAAARLDLESGRARVEVRVVEGTSAERARRLAGGLAARLSALLGAEVHVDVCVVEEERLRPLAEETEGAGPGRGILEVEA